MNPFQTNLLSSGASESEIYIWDLNQTDTPMSPGTKTQPSEDIVSLAWNRQVSLSSYLQQNSNIYYLNF